MKQEDLKLVKGSIEHGKPATICFFTDVDWWSVDRFIDEFNWIKDWVEPSEIRILINSIGGSCVDGISAFSTILNCEIPTTCIIEGIAASMGSIIWAAGDKCLMRDYALLMIHNPWAEKSDDPETQRTIDNFTAQLKTIYMKRFNMDEEKVTAIMNGEDNYVGTFFTASQAVEAGFIGENQIIETPAANKVAAELLSARLKGVTNKQAIVALMQGEIDKNLKSSEPQSIMGKEDSLTNKTNKNNMNQEFTVVAALLGLTGEKANEEAVSAKIKGLIKVEAELDALKAEKKTLSDKINALTTELAGSKASVENLTKNLEETKASLDVYKQKEADAIKASIDAMVEKAIKAGKIAKEAKDSWVKMAENDFDTAKTALDSIPARENINDVIANDPQNQANAQTQMTEEERKVEEQVKATVGENFQFRHI